MTLSAACDVSGKEFLCRIEPNWSYIENFMNYQLWEADKA